AAPVGQIGWIATAASQLIHECCLSTVRLVAKNDRTALTRVVAVVKDKLVPASNSLPNQRVDSSHVDVTADARDRFRHLHAGRWERAATLWTAGSSTNAP